MERSTGEEREEGRNEGGEERQDASAPCSEPGDAHESSSFLSHLLTKKRQKSEMSAVTEK